MSTPNRAAQLTKLHRNLKKYFKPAPAPNHPPVLESMLLACCLEDSPPTVAEQVYATLKNLFFDWNEVRVSTVKELSEVMHGLHDSPAAAARLKGVLQHVFESDYSFDLESLRKQNLGQAIKRLEKVEGASPFVVSYTVQNALGGHSIPLDKGSLHALAILGIISDSEAAARQVPGLERVIPKSKGNEFGSLLHQLGAELNANPFSPHVREMFLILAPDCKDRLPKRAVKKPPAAPPPPPEVKKKPGAAIAKSAATKSAPSKKKTIEPVKETPRKPTAAAAKPASKPPVRSPKKETKGDRREKKPIRNDRKKSSTEKRHSHTKPLAKKKPR